MHRGVAALLTMTEPAEPAEAAEPAEPAEAAEPVYIYVLRIARKYNAICHMPCLQTFGEICTESASILTGLPPKSGAKCNWRAEDGTAAISASIIIQ